MPDNFENQLRDRLEDHPSEVDALAIWEAVEGRLEKKKRRSLIWWLPGLLVMLGAIIWWVITERNNTSTSAELTTFPIPMETVLADNSNEEEQLTNGVQDFDYQSSKVFGEAEGESLAKKQGGALVSQASVKTATITPLNPAETRVESQEESIHFSESISTVTVALPFLSPALLALPEMQLSGRKDEQRLNRLARANSEAVFERSNRPHWSLALEQTVSHPWQTQIVDDFEVSAQAERNKATITPLESFSSSLLLGFHLGRRWSIRSGLTYRRINSRLDHQTSASEEFVDPEGIISIRVDGSGDSTFVTGPVEAVRTTTGTFRYYNAKTTFDLPLLLGYTFGKKRLHFGVEAGPVFNLGSTSAATLLGINDQFIAASNDNGWFRNRLSGLGWMASGKLLYGITPKTQLSLGLRYESTPGSGFENNSVGYRTRYDLLGVSLGVTRKF